MAGALVSSLNLADEFGHVVSILIVKDLFTRAIVTHQDIELAGSVSFNNGDVVWLTLATEAQSECTVWVLNRVRFAGNVGHIVKQAAISVVN